jgi:streptogramin lyase
MQPPQAKLSATTLVVAAMAFLVTMAASAAPVITEYPIPTANSNPQGIATGPDGNLWFTEFTGNKIGRITLAGGITEFPIPTPNSGPRAITAGPDGNVWFTEYTANKIGKITPSGVITEYPIPTANSSPYGIVTGPDGNLWFTESTAPFMPQQFYKIGKITTSGVVTEYSYGPRSFNCFAPTDITVGADGYLWIGGTCATLQRVSTSGTLDLAFGVNASLDSTAFGIVAGPDSNIWTTLYSSSQPLSRLNKFDQAHNDNLYTISQPAAWPYNITAGADGNLWFTEANGNQIGKITTSGVISEYAVPTSNSVPRGIASGPDGNIWFTEYAGNKIGRITTGVVVTAMEIPTLRSWGVWMLAILICAVGIGSMQRRQSARRS